jgi:hypothetical protein
LWIRLADRRIDGWNEDAALHASWLPSIVRELTEFDLEANRCLNLQRTWQISSEARICAEKNAVAAWISR